MSDHADRKTGFPRAILLMRRRLCAASSVIVILLSADNARAGPPFVTDDPEPVPFGHAEVYLFNDGALAEGLFEDGGTGVEVNYGAVPDLQLSAAVLFEYGSGSHLEAGAAEFGAKYRFIEEDEGGWRPQVAFYPQTELSLASGAEEERATRYLLPVWAQKSFGSWTAFGGGGYRINPEAHCLNSWVAGLAVKHPVGERLLVGAEIYGETSDTKGAPGLFGFSLGATRELDERLEILGSAGFVFVGNRTDIAYYLALGWHR